MDTPPHDTDPIRPIETPEPVRVRRRRSAFTWVVIFSAVSLALIALTAAVAQITLFAETDRDASQLTQVSVLVLGVAGLLAGPMALVAYWAWQGRRRPVWVAALMLPWVVVGAIWVLAGRFDWFLGAVPASVAALATVHAIWARPYTTTLNRR